MMDYNASFQISASGMAIEKLRLEVTAANLATMNVAAPSAVQVARPQTVMSAEHPLSFAYRFGQLLSAGGGVQATSLAPQATTARMVYEPGHPYADAKGFVAYPGVNHTSEMLNLNSALRAYEANVVAMTAAKTMAARTLDIGGQS